MLGNFGKSHLPSSQVDGAKGAGVGGVLKMGSSANVKSTLVCLGENALSFIWMEGSVLGTQTGSCVLFSANTDPMSSLSLALTVEELALHPGFNLLTLAVILR